MHATFGSRLKAVTVLERLVKSKRSASDLVPYHISAQLILLTYYSRYIGGTAVDSKIGRETLYFTIENARGEVEK